MIMARQMLELLFIIVIMHYSSCKDFTSTPGIVKTDPGSEIVVTWTLSKLFNSKTYLALVNIYRSTAKVIEYVYPNTPCDTHGDSRLDCVLPKTTGFIVGFRITSVRDTDAGNYKIDVIHDIDASEIKDDNAFVYVFKSPIVQISGNNGTREGNNTTLTCRATSQSLPVSLRYTAKMVYTWSINNPEGNHVVSGNQVTIQKSNKGNQGASFTCVVKEQGSSLTGSDTVTLNVLYVPGKPHVTGVPTQALIEDKDRLSVTCRLSADDLGNPQVNHYFWRNINSSYSNDTGSNNKLILSSVNAKQHDGTWQCQPENSVGQGQLTQFMVTVNAHPSLMQDLPRSSDIINTDSLSVSCSFKAKPAANITWIYEDSNNLPEAVTYTESHFNIDRVYTQTTSTLSWRQQVALDDPRRREARGRYKCHAVNNVGYRDSENMELNVLFAPYEIHLNISDLTVTEGDHVAVQCRSECNPTCRFNWTRGSDKTWYLNRDLLTLSAISRQYNDIYTCEAQNAYGTKTANLNINVNFAPEILSFVTSTSGKIIQNDTLNITCEVSSRPKSTVIITNLNTSDTILSVSDTHTAVYTFDRVHVLDSGVYQCSAANGIKPMADVSKLMTLDVKGGYDYCETANTEEGVPLNANLTVSFCLSANPFTEITTDNWMFSSNQRGIMIHALPDGVFTSIQDTGHPYKKYIMLIFPTVNENHYGLYTLKVKNNYNTEELTHVFKLLPEGPPAPPTNLSVTYITAVSVYLEWMAGFDGGPDQTFWLYVFDRDTSDWFIISSIKDARKGQGGLIEYKLAEEQGIVPDHKYNIRVGAINSISNVTGDLVMTHTKALPYLEGENPKIVYKADTAEITWPIHNLDSVTSILIDVCVSGGSICTSVVNITSPEIQPYVLSLPEQDTKTYMLHFTFYDGKDVVCTQQKQVTKGNTKKRLLIPAIVGSLLAVLVIIGIVVIIILLRRKGIIPKVESNNSKVRRHRRRKTESRDIQTYETVGMSTTRPAQVSSVYQKLGEAKLSVYKNSDVILQSVIASGDFYDIWKGKLKSNDNCSLDVVIKAIKDPRLIYTRYLSEQGESMCKLRSSDYILACYGISQDKKYLIMENSPAGDLQQILRDNSENAYYNVSNAQNLPKVMNFIHQIIRGVKSVFELQPPALFYCLSASNVLIANQQQCKLTGFATSTAVTEREIWEEQHNEPRPVRWLAPEAIKLNHIKESDIWSLGVLLWEITSEGQQPLADKSDMEAKQLILRGQRCLKPVNCSDELYDLMCTCWFQQPHKRPSILDVESQFLEITQYEAV